MKDLTHNEIDRLERAGRLPRYTRLRFQHGKIHFDPL
jgi:hypothetical protein